MTCPFARLGFERRPAIDPAALREVYLRESKAAHPDAAKDGGHAFGELRSAYETLRDPSRRLRALAGDKPLPKGGGRFAAEFQDLFFEAASATSGTDVSADPPASAIARAARAAAAKQAAHRLEKILLRVRAAKEMLDGRLEELDASWPDCPEEELVNLAADYKFADRWLEAAGEKLFALQAALPRGDRSSEPAGL